MSTTYLHLNTLIDHNIFMHIEFRRILYQFMQSFHFIDEKFDNEMYNHLNHFEYQLVQRKLRFRKEISYF